MIRLIAAIDSLRGLVSWDILPNSEYYDKKTSKGRVVSDSGALRGVLDSKLGMTSTVWVSGAEGLYNESIEHGDELYITQVNGMFDCETEFPSFEHDFKMIAKSPIYRVNGIEYQHQIWTRKKHPCDENEIPV